MATLVTLALPVLILALLLVLDLLEGALLSRPPVIAHRLTTARAADRIVVVDEGASAHRIRP
jgi:hypothetical protein